MGILLVDSSALIAFRIQSSRSSASRLNGDVRTPTARNDIACLSSIPSAGEEHFFGIRYHRNDGWGRGDHMHLDHFGINHESAVHRGEKEEHARDERLMQTLFAPSRSGEQQGRHLRRSAMMVCRKVWTTGR